MIGRERDQFRLLSTSGKDFVLAVHTTELVRLQCNKDEICSRCHLFNILSMQKYFMCASALVAAAVEPNVTFCDVPMSHFVTPPMV